MAAIVFAVAPKMPIVPPLSCRPGDDCHSPLAPRRCPPAHGGVGLQWFGNRLRSLFAGVPLRVSSLSASQSAPLLPMTDERRLALERLFARIGDVTTLPAAAQKVLKITED